MLISGCSSPSLPAPSRPGPPPDATLVFLPGIAGERPFNEMFVRAMVAERIVGDAEQLDWTAGRLALQALVQIDHNKVLARHIAAELRAIRAGRPTTRIILVAHSGGAGLAVWALEALPEDEPVVDDLILIAPALSPGYDFSPALQRVRGHAIAFNSRLDVPLLWVGTSVFGTADRVRGPAGGWGGFRPGHPRLEQIDVGYFDLTVPMIAAHINGLMPMFVHAEIAPRLRRPVADGRRTLR